MSRRTDLPVMIGKNLNKGIIAGRSEHFGKGIDLYVVRLKEKYKSGQPFDAEDIESVSAVIHFCDKESVLRTIGALTEVMLKWEEKGDEA